MASRNHFWDATLASCGGTGAPLPRVHFDERRLAPRLRQPFLERLPNPSNQDQLLHAPGASIPRNYPCS